MPEITPDSPIKMKLAQAGEAFLKAALAATKDANVGNVAPTVETHSSSVQDQIVEIQRMVSGVNNMLAEINEALDDLIVEV